MKRIILCLLSVIALVGCSNDDLQTPIVGDVTIRVTAGIESSATTKVVEKQETGLSGAQFMKLDGASVPTDFSGVATPLSGNVAALTGAVDFSPSKLMYNKDNSHAYLIAYYPAGTLTGGVVSWPIDGATDILRTNAVWDAGSYTAPLTGSSDPKLTLGHQLSQVEVVCQAEAGSNIATVRSAWGQIKKIEFVGAPTTISYALNGLTVANGAAKADFALRADYNGTALGAIDMPASSNTTANAMVMLAPTPVAGQSFQLRVTTDGPTTAAGDDIAKTIDVSLNNANAAMTAGHKHTVTLNFKANGKEVTLANSVITPWTNGHSANNDVEK